MLYFNFYWFHYIPNKSEVYIYYDDYLLTALNILENNVTAVETFDRLIDIM